MESQSRIPKKFWSFFWDVDASSIDPSKNSLFVIQRLLNKGSAEAIRWVRKYFTSRQIKESLTKLRGFNPKTANFWALFLNIPKEEILCLKTPYLKKRKQHWPY